MKKRHYVTLDCIASEFSVCENDYMFTYAVTYNVVSRSNPNYWVQLPIKTVNVLGTSPVLQTLLNTVFSCSVLLGKPLTIGEINEQPIGWVLPVWGDDFSITLK